MGEDKVYKFVEFVGTSKVSWEEAAKNAVETATKIYSDLRVAEITKLDMTIEGGRVDTYRAKVSMSFRFHLG